MANPPVVALRDRRRCWQSGWQSARYLLCLEEIRGEQPSRGVHRASVHPQLLMRDLIRVTPFI